MTAPPWSENVGAGGTSLEIVVDAVDMVRSEEDEMKSFRRALAVPAEERDMTVNDEHGRPMSTLGILRLAYVVAGLFVAGLATAFISKCAADSGPALSSTTIIGLFAFLFLAPIVGKQLLRWRGHGRHTKVRDRFTLTLDGSGFASKSTLAAGPGAPLASIERFEENGRLVLVTKDGARTRLALALDSRVENAQLAERLNDALRDVRANAGYRGALPSADAREEEDEDEGGTAAARRR